MRFLRCRRRVDELERVLRDLIDAVKSSQPEVVSNDLGNALDDAEDVLER